MSSTVPNHQTYLQFEAPTGYMPETFSSFWTLNLANGQLAAIDQGPGETPDPVIISTPDQTHAMGAYLAGAPTDYVHYARFNFPAQGTSKWSVVWRISSNINAGTVFSFETMICVGSLAEVQSCMITLSQKTGYIPCNGC